jgi:hypothetical protein
MAIGVKSPGMGSPKIIESAPLEGQTEEEADDALGERYYVEAQGNVIIYKVEDAGQSGRVNLIPRTVKNETKAEKITEVEFDA